MKIIPMIIVLFIIGCSLPQSTLSNPTSAPWLTKGNVIYQERMESTPIVWTDGSLIDVISDHSDVSNLKIQIASQGQTLIEIPTDITLICALMIETRLYIFGSTSPINGSNFIEFYYTDDLQILQDPVKIIQSPAGMTFANTSVSTGPNGFVIAAEVSNNGSGTFNPIFYQSEDLINWTKIGGMIGPNYSACPTIRYVNGWYYIFYLEHINGIYVTVLTRSQDLVNFYPARQAVIAPDSTEGQNTSDMDLVELGGIVYVNYAIGNQDSNLPYFADIKRATYQGTMQQFVEEFYK